MVKSPYLLFIYVLSNSDKLNGAAALLDSKTMEDISEKLGGDFIVLPSSIHETIVLVIAGVFAAFCVGRFILVFLLAML